MKWDSNNMKVWVVMAKVDQIQARSTDKYLILRKKVRSINGTRKERVFRNLARIKERVFAPLYTRMEG